MIETASKTLTVIEVNNIRTRLSMLQPRGFQLLNKHLVLNVPNAYFNTAYKAGKWDGKEHFFDMRTLSFPTGLLPIVTRLFSESGIAYHIQDKRTNLELLQHIQPVKYGYQIDEERTARPYQVEAYNSIVQGCIKEVPLCPFPRGVINAATNAGKTAIAQMLINESITVLDDSHRFVFLTHVKEIADQAHFNFRKSLEMDIGFIGDGKWNPDFVTVAMVPTLAARLRAPKHRQAVLDFLQSAAIVVADECHHATADTWLKVLNNMTNTIIRVGLSGTPGENDKLHYMRLKSVIAPISYWIKNETLIEQGVSAPVICMIFTVHNPPMPKLVKPEWVDPQEWGREAYRDEQAVLIADNDKRTDMIVDICKHETDEGRTVLVLVDFLHHGQSILDTLISKYPEFKSMDKVAKFIHGGSRERAQCVAAMRSGDIQVLISTTILDEGADISGINSVVYARGGQSERKLLQGLGRGIRWKSDDPAFKCLHFYDFIDTGGKYVLNHSKTRMEILTKEKFIMRLCDTKTYMQTPLQNFEQ